MQHRDRTGFAFEPLAHLGMFGELRGENLDRYIALKSGVTRLIDFTHAPGA